jgi:hypothetical protein
VGKRIDRSIFWRTALDIACSVACRSRDGVGPRRHGSHATHRRQSFRSRRAGRATTRQEQLLHRQCSQTGGTPNIPNYAKVRYRNVYPGIDLIYYGNQRQLEYDFVVNPGADPASIAPQFDSPAKPDLGRSGDLIMHTPAAELRWREPSPSKRSMELENWSRASTCGKKPVTSGLQSPYMIAPNLSSLIRIDPTLKNRPMPPLNTWTTQALRSR